MWHVSSRSGVATLRTAIHLLLTVRACGPIRYDTVSDFNMRSEADIHVNGAILLGIESAPLPEDEDEVSLIYRTEAN